MSFLKSLVGLFGDPVAENPTGVMINAAFASLGLNWQYVTFEVKPSDLQAAVNGARALGLKGFHCTIPHKVSVIAFLDELDTSAKVTGAVNCVARTEDGYWRGYNTDGKGLVQALDTDLKGLSAVVFGAGGAARAICAELALAGVSRLRIINRSPERATKMVNELKDRLPPHTKVSLDYEPWVGSAKIPAEANLVVNATSIGLYPDRSEFPIDVGTLLPHMIVADVIPNPPDTWLIRHAKSRGCRIVDGLEMLIFQGAIGVEHWTGNRPQLSAMRSALAEVFNNKR